MEALKKLNADISHPFVALVRQYRNEGKHTAEFARRAKIQASRQYGREVHDSMAAGNRGKGRPNLTPDETRELIENIIEGHIVPSALQTHGLAVQFGLIGEQITNFINQGGAYVIHCTAQSQSQLKGKQVYLDFPPGELMNEALSAISHKRKIAHRHDRFLTPDELGYNSLKRRLTFTRATDTRLVTGSNSELAHKLHSLIKIGYRAAMNPMETLLTEEEMEALCRGLRCTPTEELRLRIAHENTEAHVSFITEPRVRDAAVVEVLQAYHTGSLVTHSYYGEEQEARRLGAFEAFHTMLHTQGLALSDKAVKPEWDILTDLEQPPQARGASFDRLSEIAHIGHIEGMAEFKAHLLAQAEVPAKIFGSTRKATIIRRAEGRVLREELEASSPDEGQAR